jgi:hypothetical protein
MPFGVGGFPAGNGDGGGSDLFWLLPLLLLLLSEDVSMLDVLLTSLPSPLPAPTAQEEGGCHIFILQHANKDSYPNGSPFHLLIVSAFEVFSWRIQII